MSEKGFWQYLKKGMEENFARFHCSRHECANTAPGTPDVSYGLNGRDGWIELKILPARFKNTNTIVRLEHFTVWQKRWLTDRGHSGTGLCWFFLRVGGPHDREYLLFNYLSIDSIGFMTMDEMVEIADGYWKNRINWAELEHILTVG